MVNKVQYNIVSLYSTLKKNYQSSKSTNLMLWLLFYMAQLLLAGY